METAATAGTSMNMPEHPGDAKTGVSYADAGVNLDAAAKSVDLIGPLAARTRRPEVLDGIGGFGGMFALDTSRYRRPVLVSGTDGVGTKVDIARQLGILDTVGRDLVAMVVDDLVVCGAEPLFFNDYISVGKLDPDRVAALVAGIADGCVDAGCSLVGGETAEHPGLLAEDEFDIAGFGVAVVEQDDILGSHRVAAGDVLVGMASSGLHSNGYSLVRRIVGDRDLAAHHGLQRPLGEELLEPTRIYALACLELARQVDVHAMCHVTGGGLPENLPRILPDALAVTVNTGAWVRPEIFDWLQSHGPVDDAEMWRTFNCGVGMVAIVASDAVDAAVRTLADRGVEAWAIGEVVSGDRQASKVALLA
ncbi:MAG: phosphoribosylformylglycinamidine cyclo-ligase [Nitriliruptoraceae bacterium]